ncbi:hypothetical protein LCGC14_1939420 [marine sediment metagenome]|uniref:Uncharacterized protein n=1 Tax=marine sediment metagenome TaxID=412755 RepID=A0A0F9II44_9ZZZZ
MIQSWVACPDCGSNYIFWTKQAESDYYDIYGCYICNFKWDISESRKEELAK